MALEIYSRRWGGSPTNTLLTRPQRDGGFIMFPAAEIVTNEGTLIYLKSSIMMVLIILNALAVI